MMQPIRFIQVGVGNRGAHVLQEICSQHGAQFAPVALVEINRAFLAETTARLGLQDLPAYATLGEALAQGPEADAVVIVTPAHLHTDMVRAALLAGKHVWVEKPLCYDYGEAVELAELARRQQRAVVIGNQYQYHPLERRLQQLIQTRAYGAPFLVSYMHHRYRPEMRAFTGEYPALWEQGVHSLNSILAMLGTPDLKSVYALGLRPSHSAYRSDTVTNVLTSFADGVQAHLLVTFDSHRSDWTIRVECEQAALLLESNGWQREAIQVLAGEQVVETLGPEPSEEIGPSDPYAAFDAAIRTGRTMPTSIEVNLKTIQWIDAAVQSLRRGAVVTFAPESGPK
jgi:predicted dehydrogenase